MQDRVILWWQGSCNEQEEAQLELARGPMIRNSLMSGYEASLECDIQALNCDIYFPYLVLENNQ